MLWCTFQPRHEEDAPMPNLLAAAALVATAAYLHDPTTARAQTIDGDWCSIDGVRTMTIQGATAISPNGSPITGDYEHRFFRFLVPAGDRRAGATMSMVLLDQDTARLTDTGDRWLATVAAGELWHRCRAQTIEAAER
jgi:hypothetical protein